MKYTVDFFINKFEAIPEEEWLVGRLFYNGKCCANGWCGLRFYEHATVESRALYELFKSVKITAADNFNIWIGSGTETDANYSVIAANINDGNTKEYRQPTPKQRILAALYDIKKTQSPEVKEKIVYVAVPVTITEQAKELVMS